MNKIFKFIYALFYICIVSIIVLLLVTLFPIKGNYQIKIVKSGSMEPSISIGSVVVIKPVSEYLVGDVVTFGKDSRTEIPTTHRIVSTRIEGINTVFATKGDANEDIDNVEIKSSEVLGKVLFDVPYLGYIIDLARKPLGFAALIIIPALIIIYDEAVKIFKEIKRMRKRKEEESLYNSKESE